MKKLITLLCALSFLIVSGCVTTDTQRISDLETKVAKLEKRVSLSKAEGAASNFYPASGGLEGTGAGAVGNIGTTADKDAAVAMFNDNATWGNAFFPYTLDVDGAGTQSVPYILDAKDGGNEDWELCDVYGRSLYGLTPYKEITSSCTFGSNCDGALVRLVWGGIVVVSVDDVVVTLPEIVESAPTATQVVPGASICVINRDANENFVLDSHSNDFFTDETGTKQGTGGHYIASTASATSAGDYICVVATSSSAATADNWQVIGYRGTIVKE